MRVILIDNYSGYIWGDSADIEGKTFTEDMARSVRGDGDFGLAYAEALDRHIGGEPRSYAWKSGRPDSNETGYHVYRADVNGSEAVAIVRDGQDQETIDAVLEHCQRLGFIAITEATHD